MNDTVKMKDKTLQNNDIAVVIPAYNEWIAIGSVVLDALQYAGKVIIVDDGSKDKTSKIAELAGAEVITLEKNMGKTAAILIAFERAKEINAKATVMLDGDGQHDPAEIPLIAAPILAGEADLVIGSRFLKDDTTEDIPSYRQKGLSIINKANEISTGIECTDAVSGYRAMSRAVLKSLDFEAGPGCYDIEPQMLTRVVDLGLKVTEIPITVTYDVPHKHKMNPIRQGISILAGIIKTITVKHPLIFFGIPALISTVIGCIISGFAITIAAVGNGWPVAITIIAMILISLGILLGSVALILYSLIIILNK